MKRKKGRPVGGSSIPESLHSDVRQWIADGLSFQAVADRLLREKRIQVDKTSIARLAKKLGVASVRAKTAPTPLPIARENRDPSDMRIEAVENLELLKADLESRSLNHGWYYYETEDTIRPDGTVEMRFKLDAAGQRIKRSPDGVKVFLAIQDHRLKCAMSSVQVGKRQAELLALDADSELNMQRRITTAIELLMRCLLDVLHEKLPGQASQLYTEIKRRYLTAGSK